MANRRRKSSSMTMMFIEMGVIVVAVVLLSTLLWSQIRSLGGSRPALSGTQPQDTTTVPETSGWDASTEFSIPENATGEQALTMYAEHMGWTLDDYKMGYNSYPEKLYFAYENCPDARDFILNAPAKYQQTFPKDMSEFENVEGVPLFLQWDDRWGYKTYSYGLAGLTACGPTCLSMVAYYYTKNPDYSPDYVMQLAEEKGYINKKKGEDGNPIGGTTWELFQKGPEHFGLQSDEVSLNKNLLVRHVKNGTPVIVHVKECIFTINGHFIVVVGYDAENDRLLVRDPNSRTLTERGCTFEEIEDAIQNMWAITPISQEEKTA